MTNIDRAAQAILQSTACTATEISQTLADEGLLMPDLPRPDSDGRLWPEHDFDYSYVRSSEGNVIIERGAGSLELSREEALELASLLAAAAYAERNHHE